MEDFINEENQEPAINEPKNIRVVSVSDQKVTEVFIPRKVVRVSRRVIVFVSLLALNIRLQEVSNPPKLEILFLEQVRSTTSLDLSIIFSVPIVNKRAKDLVGSVVTINRTKSSN